MCLKVGAPPSLHYKCAACSEVIISRKIERLKNRFKTKKKNEWVVARNRLVAVCMKNSGRRKPFLH